MIVKLSKRHLYLITSLLFIGGGFYFLYLSLIDPSNRLNLEFAIIHFGVGTYALYKAWKMDKLAMAIKTNQAILPKKIRILVGIGGSLIGVGALITGHGQSTLITRIGGLIFVVGTTMFIIGIILHALNRIRKPTT